MDTGIDISQIDEEIIRLKNELSRTKSALTNQTFKRHQLVAELSVKFDEKNDRLKEFQHSNFNDLGRVLRSLYVFESRLRKEQQQIRRLLGERDSLIRQQQVEIAKLRQTLAAHCCQKNNEKRDDVGVSTSKPDLITCISSTQTRCETKNNNNDDGCCSTSSGNRSSAEKHAENVPHPSKTEGTRKNVLPAEKRTKNNGNINFNKNVYSKTVTDLSLNDISSFPNPTPNNNLFVVSNSIFSKNEFAYNEVSKEAITSVKQNGKVITSALKKPDKYHPSPKSVHFGKTTHIPEPDEDGQTDIVKTVETLLLRCGGDSCTESENDTSSTASTETSPSVSQMVRKFESICTTAGNGDAAAGNNGAGAGNSKSGSPRACNDGGGGPQHDGSYVAEERRDEELKTSAAELKAATRAGPAEPAVAAEPAPRASLSSSSSSSSSSSTSSSPSSSSSSSPSPSSLGDLDPRNNFEEFRFEDDSDLDKEYRPEADGVECPGRIVSSSSALSAADDCGAGRINYESFLEVTGLSQKSIITVHSCNRNVYGTHRNVQKPKDVKSRNRAKSASFDLKTNATAAAAAAAYPSSTVKYWTEPYL